MRYFRIVSFSGIEAHRDDADRGSLRLVEGCIPHGQGGLRSAPVWEKLGDVDQFSDNTENQAHGADDAEGNSLFFLSRDSEVHDMAMFSEAGVPLVSIGSTYPIIDATNYIEDKAILSPIGNRLYSFGDGSSEAVFIGLGNPITAEKVFPNLTEYHQEWSKFPKCTMFLVGPRKCIFAAGNPEAPLTIYITEPSGMTNPERDAPYSTELTSQNAGKLSSVDILMSDATKITALSMRGENVVVHTDKGCHLLYSPKPDQASTGFRVEQAPASVFSASVNQQVVQGETDKKYWLGADKQIYKDESSTRGYEFSKEEGDKDQASAKAKGIWEKELPDNLDNSFATYSPSGGMYMVYVESDEYKFFQNLEQIGFKNRDKPGLVLGLRAGSESDSPETIELSVEEIIPDTPGEVGDFRFRSFIYDENDTPGAVFLSVNGVTESSIDQIQNLSVSSIVSDAPGSIQLGFLDDPSNTTLIFEPDPINDLTVGEIVSDLPGAPEDLEILPEGALSPIDAIDDLEVGTITPDAPGKPILNISTLEADKPGKVRDFILIIREDSAGAILDPYKVFDKDKKPNDPSLYVGFIGDSYLETDTPWQSESGMFPMSKAAANSIEFPVFFPNGGISTYQGLHGTAQPAPPPPPPPKPIPLVPTKGPYNLNLDVLSTEVGIDDYYNLYGGDLLSTVLEFDSHNPYGEHMKTHPASYAQRNCIKADWGYPGGKVDLGVPKTAQETEAMTQYSCSANKKGDYKPNSFHPTAGENAKLVESAGWGYSAETEIALAWTEMVYDGRKNLNDLLDNGSYGWKTPSWPGITYTHLWNWRDEMGQTNQGQEHCWVKQIGMINPFTGNFSASVYDLRVYIIFSPTLQRYVALPLFYIENAFTKEKSYAQISDYSRTTQGGSGFLDAVTGIFTGTDFTYTTPNRDSLVLDKVENYNGARDKYNPFGTYHRSGYPLWRPLQERTEWQNSMVVVGTDAIYDYTDGQGKLRDLKNNEKPRLSIRHTIPTNGGFQMEVDEEGKAKNFWTFNSNDEPELVQR